MSKRRYNKAATAQPPRSRQENTNKRRMTADNFSNPFSRLGFGQLNLIETSEYPVSRLTENYTMLTSLYRNDWIASKIIDTIPEDMTKNWYSITSQLEPDQIKNFETFERKIRLKERILEGLKWGRLFGGAAGVIVLDGQEDMLEEPIDLRLIMPDSFKGIIIADRWSGVYPDSGIVQDLDDPDFGTPEYYTFGMEDTELARGVKVHHSRVLRFTGRDLPYVERLTENYWGKSELEHVYIELNKRNASSENIAQLIFQANIRNYKMADLGQTLAMTDPASQQELYRTLAMQNFLMSNMGMNVMDRDDELETHQYTFSGLSDIYEMFMLDIAGAAEIPVTRLYGRSPAGMNATGESDLTNYYDKVRQQQEVCLRPILDKLMPILCLSVWGAIPDDLDYSFNPIADTSEQERADLIQQSTAAIVSVFQSGLISQKTALMELRQSGAAYGMWTKITDEDVENADDMTDADMDEMGAGLNPTEEVTSDATAIDFPGQKRKKNGWFGEGKMHGSASPAPLKPWAKSKTAVDPKGHTVTKSYDPNDYSNLDVGYNGNSSETPTGPIQSKAKLVDHQKRHGKAMGYKNERAYSEAGVAFLSHPLSENEEEIQLTGGGRMRYNYNTNEFGCADSDGNMKTFYHPSDGILYWEDKVQKYGQQQ